MHWWFRRPCLWDLDILKWCGWDNPNTCLFSLGVYTRYNFGVTVLPLCGWRHVYLEWSDWVGPDKRRFCLGVWLIGLYFDHPWYEGNPG